MDLNELVHEFSTTPFLFVGSGFSRRYYNLPDWKGLLSVFAQRLTDDEFSYNKYVAQAEALTVNRENLLPEIAALIMQDFDARWFSEAQFRRLSPHYLEFVRRGQSPFKAEIAQYIANNSSIVPEMKDELTLLKQISSKSLAGIITTNYDSLLENETDGYKTYVGQEELIFSAIQGWAEIYKIHGSISNPESMVLTAEDYRLFQDHCPYLASKLMTIFMEYPIVFMGYSLNDPNVRLILESIVKCLSDKNLNKLQHRFIYVEWTKGMVGVEVSDMVMPFHDKVIRMTCVKTDDFKPIFEALGKKKATLPVKLVRLFKQEFYQFALTNQPTATIRVAEIDDERVGNEELVLAIGKASTLGLRGLRGLTAGEWYRNIVFHDITEFTADELLENAYPALIRQNNILPVHRLLREATKPFPDCEAKAIESFDKALNSSIRKARDKKVIAHRSISGIIKDNPDWKKAISLMPYLHEDEIDCDELELFLRDCFNQVDYAAISSIERSGINRLVKIYDYLRYGKK